MEKETIDIGKLYQDFSVNDPDQAVVDYFWNAVPSLKIHIPRDMEEEEIIIRKSITNFRIIMVIGSRLFFELFSFVKEYKDGVLHVTKGKYAGSEIAKKTMMSGLPWIRELYETGDLIDKHTIYIPIHDPNTTFVDIYADAHGLSINSALRELAKHLKISNNIFSEPKIDSRTSWCSREETSEYYQLLKNTYPFIDHNKTTLFAVQINIKDNHYTIIPETYWEHVIKQAFPKPVFAPLSAPNPLFNQIEIYNTKREGIPIILTDSLLLATQTKPEHFIWTSWYGEKNTVAKVMWHILEGRTIYYLLIRHSGFGMKDIYKTAVAAYECLKSVDKINLRYIDISKNEEGNYEISVLSIRDFLRKAKNDYNLEIPESLDDLLNVLKTGAEIKKSRKPGHLLFPFIPERSSVMLYAPTGVGKTWFAMSMAYVVATGRKTFLNVPMWESNRRKHKVVYIDTELDPGDFSDRYKIVQKIYGKKNEHFFHLLSTLVRPINLSSKEGIQDLNDILIKIKEEKEPKGKPVSLLVLDNYMNLTDFRDDVGPWKWIMPFMRKLNHVGCSVLIVHHTNKKGDEQKGSSSKDATSRNVIKLGREKKYCGENKIAMSVSIEKGCDPDQMRMYPSFTKDEVKQWVKEEEGRTPDRYPRLIISLEYKESPPVWEINDKTENHQKYLSKNERKAKIIELRHKGISFGEIAKSLGIKHRQQVEHTYKNEMTRIRILKLSQEGWSRLDIAKDVGLALDRVTKIIKKEKVKKAPPVDSSLQIDNHDNDDDKSAE